VPPDAVSRAFALVAGVRIDLRKASRLIVLGDLRVPRVTVRQEPAGPGTRVTIDISPRAAYTVSHEPRRLLVRIEADGLDVGAISAGGGLVQAITASEPATVAISLDKGFGSFRASTVPIDAASLRLVIDLMAPGSPTPPLAGLPRAQPQQPAPPPITEAPPADAAASLLPAAMPGIRTLVLDPGHGGDELGTRGSNGTLEKDLTLDVARRLKNLLESRLGIRVILTRDDDRLVPLDERASIANNNKADLFISLHANSSPNADAKGAEVFYLSLDGLNDEARKMAETSQSKPLATFGGGSRDIDLILWDMAQARHLAESSVFAGIIEEELRRRVEMSARAIQQAPFRVLVAANMPAVLVEMAFLSNVEQETQLATDAFKNGVVQSLYDAILRYRARVEAQAAGRR
jgi:N-acetylmuramoyl-L-alanine amidase